jgi:predicted glutamine amidotransferase
LHLLTDGACWPRATVVASEPLDADPGWTEVADGSVITVAPDGIVTGVAVPAS